MKILLLTCTTGEGHNSAARAIKSYLDRHGVEAVMVDKIGMFNQRKATLISDIYVSSLSGYLFKIVYTLGDLISDGLNKIHVKSPIYWANAFHSKRLYRYIKDNNYDAIICTHLFPAETMTYLKRKGLLDIPSIYVMTDYICIPFVGETETDRIIIPHSELTDHFIKKGVKAELIEPIGIPVDERKFTTHVEKEQARNKIRHMYNIIPRDPGGKWYLLMSGSMGFGDLGSQITALLEQINDNDRVICVCGNNEKVRNTLSEQFRDCKALTVLGYTNDVPLLMDACDVLFTKPGGITSTEAAVSNLPIIHTKPTAKLEEFNKTFFNTHGLSKSAESVETMAHQAMRLCYDENHKKIMLEAQRTYVNAHACRDILALMEKLIKEYEEKKVA